MNASSRFVAVAASALCAGTCATGAADAAGFPPPAAAARGVKVDVVAQGLNDPRGLAFGPGGLYVAEAGTTVGVLVPPPPPAPVEPPTRTRCEVYWPVGPKTPGDTGRVTRIGHRGVARVVVDGLPSTAANRLIGGDRMGAAAVAFRDGRLYVMVNGGGCAEGHPSEPNGLYRALGDGAWSPRVDLGALLRVTEDSKSPLDGDFEPDGTWFNLVRAFGAFWTTEPNHGLLVRIDDDGTASVAADLLGAVRAQDGDGDYTYAALTRRGKYFYVGTLGRIDQDFAGAIYRVSRDGAQVTRVASGLHGVLGIAFDDRGRMYALETTAAGVAPPLSDPTAGRLVRIERDGTLTPLVTGLAFPSALVAGPDGAFYVSNCGYHCDDLESGESLGVGQVLRVTIRGARAEWTN